MTKRQRISRRKGIGQLPDDVPQEEPVARARAKPPVSPMNERQGEYIQSMLSNQVTFGLGPAGVGKTYLAARIAAQLLESRTIRKIILTRPAVEVGRRIGFLPGEMEEKMAPYMASYGPGFRDGFGEGGFDYHLRHKTIEIVPLGFMQGRSWDEPTMVLFDEAENAERAEMKMALTRLGDRARIVIDGDPEQQMIDGQSSLIDATQRLQYVKSVRVVTFQRKDIVRSGIVRAILDAYDDPDSSELPEFITRDPLGGTA